MQRKLITLFCSVFFAFALWALPTDAFAANTPPVAEPDSYEVHVGVSSLLNPLANDSDADGDDLTITKVGESAIGDVSLFGEKLVSYRSEITGTELITYVVSDGTSAVTSAMTVTVQPLDCTATVTETKTAWEKIQTGSHRLLWNGEPRELVLTGKDPNDPSGNSYLTGFLTESQAYGKILGSIFEPCIFQGGFNLQEDPEKHGIGSFVMEDADKPVFSGNWTCTFGCKERGTWRIEPIPSTNTTIHLPLIAQ